jgi:hypothetical protein
MLSLAPRDVAHPVRGEVIMNVKATVAMILALAAGTQAAGKLGVCVNSSTDLPMVVLAHAEATMSQMLSTAGVAVEWHSAAHPVCQGLQQIRPVVIEFASNKPPGEHRGAMSYARPYEGVHIVVMYDRVENSTGGSTQASVFLAHVITHEIAHILQGISRHSLTGVMKAHWDVHDLAQMAYRPLPFAQEDVDLIRQGLHKERRAVITASRRIYAATASRCHKGVWFA